MNDLSFTELRLHMLTGIEIDFIETYKAKTNKQTKNYPGFSLCCFNDRGKKKKKTIPEKNYEKTKQKKLLVLIYKVT